VEAAGGSTKKKGWGFTSKSIFGSSATSAAASSTGPEPFDYPSARFTPPLKGIANDLANDKLSTTDFPMVPGQENTSTAAAAPQSMRRAPGWSSKKATFAGGRNFVFVAGGVTHSELKAAADVSAATNKEVILGGTSILTPTEYLNALREM
jgi:syntaxin-binding protein 1